MKEFIYALCLVGGDPFYVGKTNDLKRRMGEHTRNAAAGHTETKYQVIRDITADGEAWDYIVLAEIDSVNQPYEDFYVYLLLCDGYLLANMKAGDAAQAAEQDAMHSMRGRKERYSSAGAFLDARQREVKEAAARQATARLQAKAQRAEQADADHNPLQTLFSFENPETRFQSAAFLALKNKRGNTGGVHRGPQLSSG